MSIVIDRPSSAEIDAPHRIEPERWFNWYRALDGFHFIDTPNPSRGILFWPSKQIAETAAAELLEAMATRGVWPRGSVVWEGAFLEGDGP